MKMSHMIVALAVAFAMVNSASAKAVDCKAVQAKIDEMYASSMAQKCDGSRAGECAGFWKKMEALFDQLDDGGCESN